jgi:BTB/POZ domain-containing protein KCTD9
MAELNFFLVRGDYERLAAHELFARMWFVQHGDYATRDVPTFEGLLAVPDLGIVTAPASRRTEQYSVYPTKPKVKISRYTERIPGKKPQQRFMPSGADVDVWLLFKPCVVGKRSLVPGHFETTTGNSPTRTLFEHIKKCFEKEFVKTTYYHLSIYVGQAALALQKKGYRLCLSEYYPPEQDLRLDTAPRPVSKAKKAKVTRRRSLAETWRHLEDQLGGDRMPRDRKGKPFVPPRMPNHDDDELGFSFFRTSAQEADYSYCTLPRTFFGRSELNEVSFRNTDLSESRMCWNDFNDCDFSKAYLSGCDMRASKFVRCKFDGADLRRADLRRSGFEGSSFKGANLKGAVMDNDSAADWSADTNLSKAQVAAIVWHDNPGKEPEGG